MSLILDSAQLSSMYLELLEDQEHVCAVPARPLWPIRVPATGGGKMRCAPVCGQTEARVWTDKLKKPMGRENKKEQLPFRNHSLMYLYFAISLSKVIWTWKSKSLNYVSTQESQKRLFTWALHRRTKMLNQEGFYSLRLEIQNGKSQFSF